MRSYSTHGTTTAASPQPTSACCGKGRSGRNGTYIGTIPSWSSSCSTARSASQDRSIPDASKRNDAVGAKTCRSPVQPSRSSRCGQSVGRSTKLPRMPQTTFSCSRSTSASEQVKVPVRRRSVWTTTASRASAVSSPGQPVTSAYRKPWKVNRGSHVRGPFPSSTITSVASACAQRPHAELAVLEHLGVPDGDLGAGRPVGQGEADPADQVLAEVDQRLARRRGRDLLHRDRLGPPHRRAGRGDEGGRRRASRAPPESSPRRRSPRWTSRAVRAGSRPSRPCRCRPGSPGPGSTARSRRS